MALYELYVEGHVLRSDGLIIPPDPDNLDWQAYQLWLLGDGNTPDPLPIPEASTIAVIAESAQALAVAQAREHVARGRTAEALSAILTLIEEAP